MRKLILFFFMLLLGANGLLLWQNREENTDTKHTCCAITSNVDIRVNEVKTALFPAALGLIQ